MDYIEVEIKVQPRQPGSDLLVSQLADVGFESFQETKEGFFAWIPENLFHEEEMRKVLLVGGHMAEVTYEKRLIPSQNWNEEWEKNFTPVYIGKELIIRAPFHPAESGFKREIVIQPQQSFGTGHHQTTRLMVQKLLTLPLAGRYILDMGCGTGILGILCSKLGAENVLGIDIDANAVENARENAVLNNVKNMKVKTGDQHSEINEKFDVVLANINRNILLDSMKKYSGVLKENGSLLLSGFFRQDVKELAACAKENGLESKETLEEEEWALIHLVKK
ncbi:MAG TPA: 50S ribosomal protein L11 methyltransferase [Bacteroidia bacterium]|jgi:ribosomal protein L11 methyltransferase|nr:50S ribosomal protein L11 methyltransferase [Bacteroidia bacterium]